MGHLKNFHILHPTLMKLCKVVVYIPCGLRLHQVSSKSDEKQAGGMDLGVPFSI